MNVKLANYLAGIYDRGLKKRAADAGATPPPAQPRNPYEVNMANMGIGAGIGAGIGGLGGLLRYTSLTEKEKRRANLLNNILGGALIGGGGGALVGMKPWLSQQASDVADAVGVNGTGKNETDIVKATIKHPYGQMATRVALAMGLDKATNDRYFKWPAMFQIVRAGLPPLGDPDTLDAATIGRGALDFATGMALARPALKGSKYRGGWSFGVGALAAALGHLADNQMKSW